MNAFVKKSGDSMTGTLQISGTGGGGGGTIKSPSDGLYLIGTGTGTNEASLRITGNDDGYTDDVSVTYFQADYRSAHNLVFQSGTYGADAALARLMFNASCTQINGASYATAPVPTATLEVIGSSDQIQTKVKANATQTSNLTEWQDSAGTGLSAVSGTGNLGIGTVTPAPVVANRRVIDIEDTTGNGAEIRLNSTTAQGRFFNSNTQFGFGTDTAHALGFYTDGGGNTRLFIGPTGLIGIGTAAPTHTLTIPSASTGVASYNTADQTTNYERVRQYWDSNTLKIETEKGGSGTIRPLRVGSGPNAGININDSGGGAVTTGKIALNVAATGTAFPITNSVNVSASSSLQTVYSIAAAINQSGTAGYTAFMVNATETATGSGAKTLLDLQVGSSSKFKIDNTGKITSALAQTYTPSNVTTSRTFDADTVDVGGLADVVGTLLADLKALGVTN